MRAGSRSQTSPAENFPTHPGNISSLTEAMQAEAISHLAQITLRVEAVPSGIFSVIIQTSLTRTSRISSIYVTFWKRQNNGMEERSVIVRTRAEEDVTPEGSTRELLGVREMFCVLPWSS